MRGWLFTGIDEPLQLIEREDPVAGPGQVVVDVKAAGLCHSDCGFLDGTLTWMLPGLPMILGHEVAGTICEIGEGVTGFALGDRVVLSGPEEFAAGWRVDGGYASKCLAMASGLIPIPENVSFVQGAAATDAGMTAYGAVMGSGGLKPGMKVGIIGLGGLGMTGARIAVVNGAELTGKAVTLRGSRGGMMPGATEAVLGHMDRGELEIEATAIGFDEIPAGLDRLHKGGVVGRLVATP